MRSLMRFAFVVLLASAPVFAQQPMFEVASVKRVPPRAQSGLRDRGWGPPPPGHLIAPKANVLELVTFAYSILPPMQRLLIDWGKHWDFAIREDFDVEAKGDPKNDVRMMTRGLLQLRFGLRTHVEKRELEGFAVVVKEPGKLGPYLKPTTVNCAAWGMLPEPRPQLPKECTTIPEWRFGTRVANGAGSIASLIQQRLQGGFQVPLVDATGLEGNFAWEFAAEASGRREEVPNFITAIEDQLGLKLEKRTVSVDVLVIDDVQMPTEN